MSYKKLIFLVPLLLLGIIAAAAHPAAAEPPAQVLYQTPTANPDGRVLYIVEEGDTCLRIQLLTGVTVETLRNLNKLDQNCTINPGQELLLALIVPEATVTPNPNVTATALLPTPTPFKGNGSICALLYNDVNGNAVHEESEAVMAGGEVSVSNRAGSVSQTGSTSDDPELPMCMEVPEGEFNISMGIPTGYNGTTLLSQVLDVKAGEVAILEFGAQISSIAQAAAPVASGPVQNSSSGIALAVLGGLLILGGIGLGVYILLTRGK